MAEALRRVYATPALVARQITWWLLLFEPILMSCVEVIAILPDGEHMRVVIPDSTGTVRLRTRVAGIQMRVPPWMGPEFSLRPKLQARARALLAQARRHAKFPSEEACARERAAVLAHGGYAWWTHGD